MLRNFIGWLRRDVFKGEPLGLAMPGFELQGRIRRMLDRVPVVRTSRLRIACATLLCSALSVLVATSTLGHAQFRTLPFEVATVKPNQSGSPMARGPSVRGGQFVAQNVSLKTLLSRAYQVREFQISGPTWIETTKYDIAAKASSSTPPDQVWPMLRALLEDRLRVTTHRDVVERNLYALVTAKEGPKFRQLRDGEEFKPKFPFGASFVLLNGDMGSWGEVLSPLVGRPVLDKTGLAGTYQFMLAWDGGKTGTAAPDIFEAVQEQLGLKLEPRKGPVEMLIVDRADKIPAEN